MALLLSLIFENHVLCIFYAVWSPLRMSGIQFWKWKSEKIWSFEHRYLYAQKFLTSWTAIICIHRRSGNSKPCLPCTAEFWLSEIWQQPNFFSSFLLRIVPLGYYFAVFSGRWYEYRFSLITPRSSPIQGVFAEIDVKSGVPLQTTLLEQMAHLSIPEAIFSSLRSLASRAKVQYRIQACGNTCATKNSMKTCGQFGAARNARTAKLVGLGATPLATESLLLLV